MNVLAQTSVRAALPAALLVVALASCQADSPHKGVYLNASFEHSTPQGQPVNWYVEADSAGAQVMVDDVHVRDGASALHVHSQSGEPVFIYTPLWNESCLAQLDAAADVFLTSPELSVSLFYLTSGSAPLMGESSSPSKNDQWQSIAVSRSSEEECAEHEIMLGILVSGTGEAWIDGIELNVSPPHADVTENPPRPHTVHDLDRIRAHAVSPEQREGVRELFKDARIVGLGENSHGARALFDLKLKLVRVLVEDLGFDILALEMPAERATLVNDYIQGRSDDKDRTLLALSYPAWQSAEMWAVIEWLRVHNRNAKAPVTFFGLDTPSDERSEDERMTDRVTEIIDKAGADARAILWADNTHVTEAGQAMGAQLSRQYRDGYVSVGLTFNEGHYSANGPDIRYRAHESWPGTHEHILAATGLEAFLLNLDALPRNHALLDRRNFRYIGSRPQEFNQFYPHRLEEHFDVVGFVRETDSTEYLLEHEF